MNGSQVIHERMREGWQNYQAELVRVIGPLTEAQLAQRTAANQRTLGELAEHIVRARALWMPRALGYGDATLNALANWDEPDDPPRSAAEIVAGLEATWEWVLKAITPAPTDDPAAAVSAAEAETLRVAWGMFDHELHHGGELAYTLGALGLESQDM
jgi:uncharacterized damage-inducible protein DinB